MIEQAMGRGVEHNQMDSGTPKSARRAQQHKWGTISHAVTSDGTSLELAAMRKVMLIQNITEH